MKIVNIDMEWTDNGARVLSSLPMRCPRCEVSVDTNVEHLCGDRAPKPFGKAQAKVGPAKKGKRKNP